MMADSFPNGEIESPHQFFDSDAPPMQETKGRRDLALQLKQVHYNHMTTITTLESANERELM